MQHQSTGALSALGVTAGQRGGDSLCGRAGPCHQRHSGLEVMDISGWEKNTNLLLLLKLIEK